MKRLLTRSGMVAACLMISSIALAADPLTLKVEPGVAGATSTPQSDRFDLGAHLAVKPLVGLTSYLDVGPSLSLLALPSSVTGTDVGTALGLGGTVRLKRPRDESNTGTGFKAVSPWVDGDLQYVRTGALNRAGISLAAGAAVPTSNSRSLWVGPFVRYQDIVQTQKSGFDSTDAHVLIAGVSFEFGTTTKKKAEKPTPCPPTPEPVKVEKPKTPNPKPPTSHPPVTVELKEKVQFKFDSAELQDNTKAPLDAVLKVLNDHPGWNVQVEGHASSEGSVTHNDKLSVRRAQSVANYLTSHGVSADRVSVKGFGSSVPVASNTTEAGRVANRRVEFNVSIKITNDGGSK